MKDKLLFLSLLLTVLFSVISANTQAASNMLLNPSFEIDDNGDWWPDNWGGWNAEWSYGGDGHNIYYAGDPEQPARTGDDCAGVYGTDYALWVQDIETGFEIGKTYIHEGEIGLCCSGFHFHQSSDDMFRYYDDNVFKTRVGEIEAENYQLSDDKAV